MAQIGFPVAEGEHHCFPRDSVCPICRQQRVGEPHRFVGLSGGSAAHNLCGEGFLAIFVHPRDESSERGAEVEIVRDTSIGQFDLCFCSTLCLRRFLNQCVDELEARLGTPAT